MAMILHSPTYQGRAYVSGLRLPQKAHRVLGMMQAGPGRLCLHRFTHVLSRGGCRPKRLGWGRCLAGVRTLGAQQILEVVRACASLRRVTDSFG